MGAKTMSTRAKLRRFRPGLARQYGFKWGDNGPTSGELKFYIRTAVRCIYNHGLKQPMDEDAELMRSFIKENLEVAEDFEIYKLKHERKKTANVGQMLSSMQQAKTNDRKIVHGGGDEH